MNWFGVSRRAFASLGGGLGDFIAMLVCAGQEIDPFRTQPKPLEPGHGVGQNGGVGVSEMRGGVDVVDGRGKVVGLVAHSSSWSWASGAPKPPLLQPPPPPQP